MGNTVGLKDLSLTRFPARNRQETHHTSAAYAYITPEKLVHTIIVQRYRISVAVFGVTQKLFALLIPFIYGGNGIRKTGWTSGIDCRFGRLRSQKISV
ncbi:MAG: hypothetical protein AAFS12_00185 [Cyanobacteria bacterium J06632_19]